ncbi:hypothetical protein L1887_17821 [Cichorium endivia]|nr:hypothetical protein L1887_17821 [Cichorium endivia]
MNQREGQMPWSSSALLPAGDGGEAELQDHETEGWDETMPAAVGVFPRRKHAHISGAAAVGGGSILGW